MSAKNRFAIERNCETIFLLQWIEQLSFGLINRFLHNLEYNIKLIFIVINLHHTRSHDYNLIGSFRKLILLLIFIGDTDDNLRIPHGKEKTTDIITMPLRNALHQEKNTVILTHCSSVPQKEQTHNHTITKILATNLLPTRTHKNKTNNLILIFVFKLV